MFPPELRTIHFDNVSAAMTGGMPFIRRLSRCAGMDHLLVGGRGAGGVGDDAVELKMACLMGLLSFFSSQPEVLRVSSRHAMALSNAAATANIQSATVTDTPLTDAGLDGSGEIIQAGSHP